MRRDARRWYTAALVANLWGLSLGCTAEETPPPPAVSNAGPGSPPPCVPGRAGCDCDETADGCEAGLTCWEGRCVPGEGNSGGPSTGGANGEGGKADGEGGSGGGGGDAETCPAPIVATRDTDATDYEDLFGLPWPGTSALNANAWVDAGSYMALRFVAQPDQAGVIDMIEAPFPGFENAVLVSIDRCPGVFPGGGDPCQSPIPIYEGATPYWTTREIQSSPVPLCELEAGNVYYLNLFFGTEDGTAYTGQPQWVTRISNDWN